MKSRYGVTPWGNWFVRVLGSYEVGSRLARGKTYANTGRVLSLELKDGWAVAKVEGNFLPFYRVEINFPPLAQAEKVYEMIEGDPPLLAHIAAGELPETFLQKLIDMDIDLIPRRWQDMKRLCTCPDYGDPCKHMAALYYIIAAEIDADPHVLFRLRGMDLAARFGKAAVRRIAPPFTVAFVRGKKSARAKALPLAASPEIEPIPPCGELISALLPPSPPFSDKDFAAIMADFYRRCAGRYDNGGRHDDSARRHGENLHYGSVRPSRKPVVETVGDSAETEHGFSRSVWTVLCPSPGPGANVALEALDVNGKREQYSLQEAFEYFVDFSSEDGTESYRFLFFVFRFLNLVCSAGAFIPYVLVENKTMAIVWRPFETLPPVQGTLEALASLECGMLAATGGRGIADGRGVVDLLASSFLNGLVRRRFSAERDKF
ncbi:MAG: SWIM zinc finger family protein, partial [Treponema sp.]|nr:SWIM zinc finger family protein [Treponema sp.]